MSLDINVSYLSNDDNDRNNNSLISLKELQIKNNNKPMVVDFWSTKCVRCPASMDHLNDEVSIYVYLFFIYLTN
jgi:thiol-disulfide isomerase/thioredoxin